MTTQTETTGPQQPSVLPAMEHVPTKHLHQLCRGLGHQDLGQGLQVGAWQRHDDQPYARITLGMKNEWRIGGLQENHALGFIFSEVLSSLLTWTLNLVMWPGLLIQGPNLFVLKRRIKKPFCSISPEAPSLLRWQSTARFTSLTSTTTSTSHSACRWTPIFQDVKI